MDKDPRLNRDFSRDEEVARAFHASMPILDKRESPGLFHDQELQTRALGVFERRHDTGIGDPNDTEYLMTLTELANARVEKGEMAEQAKHGMYDTLTGLRSRYHLEVLLRNMLTRAERSGHEEEGGIVAFLIDVNNFKQVNDANGQVEGDVALRGVGPSVEGAIRGSDIFGRWGGDEFLILVEAKNVQEVFKAFFEGRTDNGVRIPSIFETMQNNMAAFVKKYLQENANRSWPPEVREQPLAMGMAAISAREIAQHPEASWEYWMKRLVNEANTNAKKMKAEIKGKSVPVEAN